MYNKTKTNSIKEAIVFIYASGTNKVKTKLITKPKTVLGPQYH